MAIEGGMGAKVKISITGVMTAVAHLQDIDGVTLRKTVVEATGHDAAGGYAEFYDSGKRTIPALKLTLAWDKSDSTHAALVAAYNSTSAASFSVEDPGGTEVIAFSAHVVELGRQYKQNGVYMCSISIQPTGQPTITP